jgi:hypothetical protein
MERHEATLTDFVKGCASCANDQATRSLCERGSQPSANIFLDGLGLTGRLVSETSSGMRFANRRAASNGTHFPESANPHYLNYFFTTVIFLAILHGEHTRSLPRIVSSAH